MLKGSLILLSLLISSISYADRIYKLEIDVYLNTDRSVNVKEVYSFRPYSQIKHGLYRFLPVKYYNNANDVYGAPLTINNILVNGDISPYHVKDQMDYQSSFENQFNVSNGKAIGFKVLYIGSKGELLAMGEPYTTTIDYSMKNVVLDENGRSRFSWNIQGFGWEMNREAVTTRFHFPKNITPEDVAFFIGSIRESDSLDTQYYSYDEENNMVTLFYKQLLPGQDITIDSYFTLGSFDQGPSGLASLFSNYKAEMIIWITFVLTFLIWFFIWLKVGRDPKGLIRMTRFESPDDMSPAECRYFREESIDKRTSIATIVHAAIKGYVKIEKRNETAPMIISKTKSFTSAPKEVHEAFSSLFGKTDELKVQKSSSVASKFDSFIKRLKKPIVKKYPNQFQHNFRYFLMGFLFAFVGFLWSIFNVPDDTFRNIFAFGIIPLVFSVITMIGVEKYMEETESKTKSIIVLLGAIVIGTYIYFIPMILFISNTALFGFVALSLSAGLWRYLMKNRTAFSREMEDKIMGYEHYLRSTEERYLDFLNEPETAPVLFEKHLPFAIALGCESRWSDAFEKYILDVKDTNYQPSWFLSTLGYHWIGHNMYSNISANSVSPPSTSGSSSYSGGGFGGGGGFSGGGFGGGGGGGW